jgi:protein ImuB
MPYACIFIPDFPAQAILRAEPELNQSALVVLDGRAPVPRPMAMNAGARRAGVQTETPKTLLEQCPSLLLRARSPALERAAQQALLEVGKSFSPRVEEVSSGTVMMDLTGMEKLFGPPPALAAVLSRRLQAKGLEAQIAVASNSEAALAAARGRAGVTVIPAGREADVLGPLPLAVLDPPPEILETLERWGIHNFKGLAALPTAGLSERLGQLGVRLQALARGQLEHPLIASNPAAEFVEQMELEYPIEELEPLAFILNRLLESLCRRLNAYSAATREIALRLNLQTADSAADRSMPGQYEKCIRLPVATRDAKLLLNLLRIQLQAEPPAAPILRAVLRATPAPPRTAQGGLFAPLSPDPEKLELTLARIAGLVGRQNVGSPRLLDSHRPETFEMRPFALAPLPKGIPSHAPAPADGRRYGRIDHPLGGRRAQLRESLVLRIFRPPAPAWVKLQEGAPHRVAFGDTHGQVVTAGGPWRTSGGWWQSEAWQYDEWDVEIKTAGSGRAGFYRIYFDRAVAKWFVRGEYD